MIGDNSVGRAEEIAYRINHHLPECYRGTLLNEARRVEREVLAPRGLPRQRILSS